LTQDRPARGRHLGDDVIFSAIKMLHFAVGRGVEHIPHRQMLDLSTEQLLLGCVCNPRSSRSSCLASAITAMFKAIQSICKLTETATKLHF
jgi:hypothetical protein